jgi:oligopeptide transport system substrate-binding protein
MDFRKRRKIFVYSVLLTTFCLFTIVFKFNSNKGSKQDLVLKISLPNDIRSLDPAFAFEKNSSHVVNMVFEGLMRRGVDDIPHLAIAESVDISRDQVHYVFHLRDCNWSDGVPITAYDFEFSWKRSLDPSSKPITEVPYYFYPIKNAKDCLTGQVSVDKVCVHAIDAKTLVVELEYPSPYFLDIVSLPYFYPNPRHFMENDPNWGNDEKIICNGPFKLKCWKRGNRIEVVKNPDYWDQENVHLDGIYAIIMENPNTALLMYEKGELDWIGDPFIRLSYDVSSQVLNMEKESAQAYWFFVNTEKYPLNNEKLRKALSYSINRQLIVNSIFHNSGEPAMSLLSPPLRLGIGNLFKDNNITAAQKLFQEALEELDLSAEELPEIELRSVAGLELHRRIAQSVQDQWRSTLGIKNVVFREAEWSVHYDSISRGDYDVGFMGWCISIPDSLFLLNAFKDKNESPNKSRWENPHYKKCLDQVNLTVCEIERVRILSEAENLLINEMPVIPLCFIKQRFAKNPRLKGERLSPFHFIDFKSAYFENKD